METGLCRHNGTFYGPGEEWMEGLCRTCKCRPRDGILCTQMDCPKCESSTTDPRSLLSSLSRSIILHSWVGKNQGLQSFSQSHILASCGSPAGQKEDLSPQMRCLTWEGLELFPTRGPRLPPEFTPVDSFRDSAHLNLILVFTCVGLALLIVLAIAIVCWYHRKRAQQQRRPSANQTPTVSVEFQKAKEAQAPHLAALPSSVYSQYR